MRKTHAELKKYSEFDEILRERREKPFEMKRIKQNRLKRSLILLKSKIFVKKSVYSSYF